MSILQIAKTSYDDKTKIWSGIKAKLPYGSECSLGQVLLESLMSGDPEHIAQICCHNGKQYTNREIATLSIRIAQNLRKLNLEQCDVIGLCASNSDYVAPLFIGAMLNGLIVSTLDPSFDKDGIKHIYSITKPKVMFCDGDIHQVMKEGLDEIQLPIKIYTMKNHIENVPQITDFMKPTGSEGSFKPEPLIQGSSQVAAILCSSGTTGLPKGVCMSHASLLNVDFFTAAVDDRMLCFSTLYWLSGLINLVHGTQFGATRVITEKGFSPEHFFDIVEKYKVTNVLTPPSQLAMSLASPKIGNFDLSSVNHYLCGGSAVHPSFIKRIKNYFPNAEFIVGYGMSEVSGVVAFGVFEENGTVGQLATNCEVKIFSDDGEAVGPNQHGEILIKTIHPWAGYYNNPEATAGIYDEDGWVHSGDIGYMDDTANLFIVDRKKDILKYNNFHFFPTEIENVIIEIPGIAEVCACGVADIVTTHQPAAAIVLKPESSLTEADIYNYVATRMAHFKHLRGGIYFFNELPKTASGKYLRREITNICEKRRNTKLQSNGKLI